MGATNIEWADATWNVITGCTKVSEGCRNCYAMTLAAGRLQQSPRYVGLGKRDGDGNAAWTGKINLHPDLLDQPLRWRKPQVIFPCSMSDMFHEDVPDEFLARIFNTFEACARQEKGHRFMVLTKRVERMHQFVSRWYDQHAEVGEAPRLEHVWFGASMEDQATANERIPRLLMVPAAMRFISAEPLLGSMILNAAWCGRVVSADPPPRIDLVITGGESGAKARPMHPDWPRALRNQCARFKVAFQFKQWGRWKPIVPVASDDTDNLLRERDVIVKPDGKLEQRQAVLLTVLANQPGQVPWASWWMRPCGKKKAGRLLDGNVHHEEPTRPHPIGQFAYCLDREVGFVGRHVTRATAINTAAAALEDSAAGSIFWTGRIRPGSTQVVDVEEAELQ